MLVGDSSDDEEQFEDSFRCMNLERSSSCALEDSITEYSLIRKWLLNAEDSPTSSEDESKPQTDISDNQTGNKSAPAFIHHVSLRASRGNEESIILLSSGDEDPGLGMQ